MALFRGVSCRQNQFLWIMWGGAFFEPWIGSVFLEFYLKFAHLVGKELICIYII